jgi:hypothetical protein
MHLFANAVGSSLTFLTILCALIIVHGIGGNIVYVSAAADSVCSIMDVFCLFMSPL